MIPTKEYEIFNARGRILVHIAANPDCTIEGIAEAVYLTRRTVWGIIGQLRRAGMIGIRKVGRRHHYAVNLSAPLHHPTVKGCTLKAILFEVTGTMRYEYQ